MPSPWLRGLISLGFWIALAAFCLPLGRRPAALRILPSDAPAAGPSERVDERGVLFAREEYRPGTERYRIYYEAHPQHQAVDDRIRRLPELLASGGLYHDPGLAALIRAQFAALERLTGDVAGTAGPQRADLDAASATVWVKQRLRQLGADEVGVTLLDPRYVYSHVGRGPQPWGQPIDLRHRFAIAFALEMETEAVNTAPRLPITRESARQYLRGARMSIQLAAEIRARGYPARAHIAGSNYQIMLPPVAHQAGLGELGRMGYLISPRFGPRIRLGAITTDLPLETDAPVAFGVQEFCRICKRCCSNCPSGSIPSGGRVWVRGVEKWLLDSESCLHYWRVAGSDCGICMRVCPYSHPPTWIHNRVRRAIRRSALARRVSVWGEDLIYGRKIPLPLRGRSGRAAAQADRSRRRPL